MQIILLSGGSGKRLWPLSNEIRSKQFLKVVRNESGEVESMLQRVYRQLSDAGLGKDVTIATGETQVESIQNQLNGQVSIVVEPERRNTFPAILLAAAYLYFEKKCDPSETVVILPVDPYVDQAYFRLLKELDKAAQANLSDIVLMGVKPTYPSEKYGYIIPEDRETPVSRVLEFREKPDAQTAQGFIDKGGLWNCGVFALKLSYLMEFVKRAGSSYEEVADGYSGFERTSFDYAVVEKADSVSVIRYEGEWKDLGTWNTLTEVMDETPIGDVQIADSCINTHVINELELPMVVMGVKDMVVAASPDGILVADKEQSSYIKKYVEDRDMRPMFEERSWGEYKVLDYSVGEDGTKVLTKRKKIQKGRSIAYQSHQSRMEVLAVISGKCAITIDGCTYEAGAGDAYTVSVGAKHGLDAVTDVELIEIQVGEELIKDGTELDEK